MPTTSQEAETIVRISTEYISPHEMRSLFTRLDTEVGQVSENDSVKESFKMFRALSEQAMIRSISETERARLTIYWFLIWIFHSVLIFGNLAAFFVAPFYAPWYLAFPACFAIIWTICSSASCAITEWENRVREQLGWTRIRGFIGHYYIKPVRKLRRKLQ